MKTIAFFAHDEKDAAVRRRVAAFERIGCRVVGFSMRRAERADQGWNVVDLGRTFDANYRQRLGAIFRGARKAAAARELLAGADVVYARNLDMALCAQLAMRRAGLSKPLVYECLDVHKLMHREDAVGFFMRRLERQVLKQSALLVVSSPAFLRDYFNKRHAGRFRARLVENRLAESTALGPRPTGAGRRAPPLSIGWFGVLRCRRSLELLEDIALRFADGVEILMRGYPDLTLPDFHERVRRRPNMRYRGRYKSPDDLSEIYAGVDVVWAGDFHDAGFNSRWLLPNRLYEGGYFAAPAIAPADSETGRWIEARGAGFALAEPLDRAFPALVQDLIDGPGAIANARARLLALPHDTFVQPESEMRAVIDEAMTNHAVCGTTRTPAAAAAAF